MGLPRLLLVENDPYYIYLLRMYAEQSGFAVVVASSGMGVEALAQQEARCHCSGVRPPEVSG